MTTIRQLLDEKGHEVFLLPRMTPSTPPRQDGGKERWRTGCDGW